MTTNFPTNIQTGYLYDMDGSKFDISVILNFPTDDDYDNDDFPSTNLIDFYFGEPNDESTNEYVTKFVNDQNKFIKLLEKLTELKKLLPDDSDIDEQIEFVKSRIVKLH